MSDPKQFHTPVFLSIQRPRTTGSSCY